MRAINLIPPDERRGAGGAGGRSAGGAYVLLGALVALVAMVASYTVTVKSVHDRKGQLANVQRGAAAAEAEAASLASYTAFKQMREQRVATVKSIAASRFDWAHAMHETARTLPPNAALGSMRGTVVAGVPLTGGTTVAMRGALPSMPAIEMAGCVPSQGALAHMLVNLRRVDGVRRVSLQQSARTDSGGSTSSSATTMGGLAVTKCDWQFQVVVFYDPATAITPPATSAVPGTATTTGATQ